MKFYTKEFRLTAADAKKLQEKISIFEDSTGTRKQLMLVLITTFGIQHNQHSLGLVQGYWSWMISLAREIAVESNLRPIF